MNYRHIYHAGNFADVIKHIVLMRVLDYLKQKDKAFFVLDTHAGIGLYDLDADQARRTAEADDGIARVMAHADTAPDAVRAYVDLVRGFNRGDEWRTYPGSPAITHSLIRDQDRMVVNELHPDDVVTLDYNMGRDGRVRVEHMDAYQAIKALLPPPERRGMVLVDPPFEVTDEFARMTKALVDAHKRWATGVYAFWYPIKDPRVIARWHNDLADTGIPKIMAVDFMIRPASDPTRLNGSGLVLVNAPWTLESELNTILPWLVSTLTNGVGSFTITRLTGE